MTTFLPAEVAQTLLKLTAGPDSVVVGGQAVSLWAAKFGLLRPDVALTRDLDLLGMAENVDDAAQAIRAAGMTVRAYLPALEDITPISGKLSVDVPRLKEPVEIDFLHQVDGLNASDIQERALSHLAHLLGAGRRCESTSPAHNNPVHTAVAITRLHGCKLTLLRSDLRHQLSGEGRLEAAGAKRPSRLSYW